MFDFFSLKEVLFFGGFIFLSPEIFKIVSQITRTNIQGSGDQDVKLEENSTSCKGDSSHYISDFI